MVKILINNTATILNLDIGISVPASSQTTIQPLDYLEAADSDELVELIGNGTITVNDGNENLTKAQGMALIQSGFRKTDFDDNLIESNRLKVDVVGTLGDGKVKVSNSDSAASFLNDKILSGSSKLSKTINNTGNNEELQLDVVPSNINTSELNNDASFINSSQAPVQPSDISDFETSSQLNTRDTLNRNRSNHTGTQTVSTISDFNTGVQSAETDTTLSFNNTTKVLSYVNEAGTTTNVDLTQFLDDTNLARIVSGTLNAGTGIATFTRDDSTTFTIDMSSLNDQAFITAAINTHEVTINNHDDVDTSTEAPTIGSRLRWNGTDWTPSKDFKDFARRTDGLVNQTTTEFTYLTLTTTVPEAGDYKISWSYNWSLNSTGSDIIIRVLQGVTELLNHIEEPQDSAGTGINLTNTTGGTTNTGTDQRRNEAGFDVVSLAAGSNTFTLTLNSNVASTEAALYKACLTLEKWEL